MDFLANILSAMNPISIIMAAIVSSFIVGLPLALILTDDSLDSQRFRYTLTCLSTIVGFSLLHLVIFFATLVAQKGTDDVSAVCFFCAIGLAAIIIFFRRKRLAEIYRYGNGPLILFAILLPLAAAHILIPVITGRWEMAYATGDDSSRWYMVVTYFRHNTFEYMKITEETLKWSMRERPLQNVSGAIIASLSGSTPAIAYSVSSALAMIMAALSFCLLFESFFRIQDAKFRYVLWAASILFFGFFGSFTNIYYTSRVTHHFSVYPVLASLGFLAVKDRGVRRLLWFVLWEVLLAYYYSIRFAMSFISFGLAMVFFQWIGGEIKMKDFIKNAAGMMLGFAVAALAAYGETKVIIGSLPVEGLSFFMMQRAPGYGSDGTALDRLFKWSGFLGTYESHEGLKLVIQLGLGIVIVAFLLISLVYAVKVFRSSSAYTGLVSFSLVSATWLLLNEQYFVAWKSALYWPSFALLGILAFAFMLMGGAVRYKKRIGFIVIPMALLYIASTGRQIKEYVSLADVRYTKVDKISYQMVDTVRRYMKSQRHTESGKIFGFDYSGERHLLYREVFRDFDWQPVRGKELGFENDLINKTAQTFNDYRYDVLFYAQGYKCEPFDFSGNRRALIYDHPPFKLYTSKSSFPELITGIDIKIYGFDEERRCPMYGGKIVDDTSSVIFVNNGSHDWMTMTLRCVGDQSVSDETFPVSTNGEAVRNAWNPVNKNQDYSEYELRLTGLATQRLWRIVAVKKNLKNDLFIVQTKWGYGQVAAAADHFNEGLK